MLHGVVGRCVVERVMIKNMYTKIRGKDNRTAVETCSLNKT